MEHPLKESLWRRGWNDTKAIWGSWPFYIFDVVVAAVIGGVFEWYWGLVVVIFGMICVWMGATARSPIKQRDEARGLVEELRKPSTAHNEVTRTVQSLSSKEVGYLLEHSQLATGMAWYGAQDPLIEALSIKQVIQLTQRREVSGTRAYDQSFWMLTDFGKDVIRYLETNKQVLDKKDSQR